MITAKATSIDADCTFVQVTRIVRNGNGGGNGICEAPVSGLAVTSHTNNQQVTGNTVTLSGVVSGNVSAVTVNGNAAAVSGGVWTITANLQSGTTTFTINAYSTDADCTPVTTTLILNTPNGGGNYCEILVGLTFLSGQSTTVNSSTSTYTIYGKVNTGVSVMFGSSSIAVDASGNFNVTVTLVNGTNTFTFVGSEDTCTVSKTITIVRNTNNGGSNGGGTNGYGGGTNSCGDGIVRNSEQCDDGNTVNGDGCDNNCRFDNGNGGSNICGNNIVQSGETCDDGNTRNGDGCSSICTRETGADSDTVRNIRRIKPLPET